MANNECAKFLVELHADYFNLAEKYGVPVVFEYAEAVAMAIMALADKEVKEDGNAT